jgi:ATP-dependent Clp protease ATP-binding subunit ClpC
LRSNNSLPKHLRKTVECDDIWEVLSDKLWIPVDQITDSEIAKLRNLDKLLSDKLLWQEEIIKNIVNSIKRNRLSVIQKDRPIASFLFLWPSWVWKTYIAKLLANDFFWDPKSLTRVDMSEFMEKHSASKLIWSAPWYVGYDEWWILTEAVRRKPYSVILFDEIEKASKDVLNVLLQVLDEWVLKDNKWRLINFKNTIIILTSNIWSTEFQNTVSKIWFNTFENWWTKDWYFEEIKERILAETKDYLTPELINRLDHINVFKPLSKEVLSKIFDMEIKQFLTQWKTKKWVKLPTFNKKKIWEIVSKIYEPQYWARPISKYINTEIEPELIEQLMNNW